MRLTWVCPASRRRSDNVVGKSMSARPLTSWEHSPQSSREIANKAERERSLGSIRPSRTRRCPATAISPATTFGGGNCRSGSRRGRGALAWRRSSSCSRASGQRARLREGFATYSPPSVGVKKNSPAHPLRARRAMGPAEERKRLGVAHPPLLLYYLRHHISPRCLKLANSPPGPTITWLMISIPMISAALDSRWVIQISSWDGCVSPLGWLWTRAIAEALVRAPSLAPPGDGPCWH